MRLLRVNFDGPLGLKGSIDFTQGPVLLYGENIAGKSNAINMTRYLLVPVPAKGRRYSEEKRLTRDELLIEGSTGRCDLYFSQMNKLYRISLEVGKKGEGVKETLRFFEHLGAEVSAGGVNGLEWKETDVNSPRRLKEKLEEIGCHPDLIDTLISPSNVRNFADAISGELVSIPAMVQREIQGIHDGSLAYIRNIVDFEASLSAKREETSGWEEQARREFTQLASPLHIDLKCFERGAGGLEPVRREVGKRLEEEIPKQMGRIAELSGKLKTKEIERKIQAILDAEVVLSERKSALLLMEELGNARTMKELLTRWSGCFKQLPPVSRPQDLQSFSVPDVRGVDSSAIPKHTLRVLDLIREAKGGILSCKTICVKHKIPIDSREIKSRTKSYRELLKAIKHPSNKAKGVNAIVFKENDRVIVSIPLDEAVKDPSVFTELEPVPRVHKPMKLKKEEFKRETRKCEQQIRRLISELNDVKGHFSKSKRGLSEAKNLIALAEKERSSIETKARKMDESIQKSLARLNRACGGLVRLFDIQVPEVKGTEFIGGGYDALDSGLEGAKKSIEEETKSMLKEFPEVAGKVGKIGLGSIRDLMSWLEREQEELSKQSEAYRRLAEWIDLNMDAKRRNDSMSESIEILDAAAGVAKSILSMIAENTDLGKIIEQVSAEVERGVADMYSSVFAEPSFAFTHLEKGKFVSSVESVPITHPGGSEKAVISMGIMATIARCFDFPLILDEALDRIDVDKVVPLLGYATGLSSRTQLCLVVCRSFNIEKNPVVLPILDNWRIYRVSRRGREKFIELVEPSSILT